MPLLLFFSALIFSSILSPESWTITEDYSIKFATTKAEGTFKGLEGTILFAEDQLAKAKFDVWVATASVSTGNKSKDKHARGEKWLNAKEHPQIRFQSASFTLTDSGYQVNGNLSIKGITKVVSIPFEFKNQVFSGSITINRQDFGIKGPFLFGGLVGNDIEVSLNVPVAPKK